MTARERVVQVLGGACRYCGATQDLQIDHVYGGQGEGTAHRKRLNGVKLAVWLCQQHRRLGYWPAGYQLLCLPCHQAKTQRTRHMPARTGATQLNITLDDDLAAQVSVLAKDDRYQSKSGVVEAALHLLVGQAVSEPALGAVHDHVAKASADIVAALHGMTTHLDCIHSQLETVSTTLRQHEQRQNKLESDLHRSLDSLTRAYDALHASLATRESKGLLRNFLG